MKNVMAIDIGTGFAKAAIVSPDFRDPILLIPGKFPMGIPSIAYVDANGVVKASANSKIRNCSIVRNIKTRLSEKTVSVTVSGNRYDLETAKIYGEIARELITVGNEILKEQYASDPVYDVVVTYPAAFIHSENPRLTTKNVETIRESIENLTVDGHKISVVKMIPEPVAAAYEAISFERNVKENPITDENYNVAVFDLGHGTFDVAVVTSTNEPDQPFDVIAQGGDNEIGGRIFDKKIFDRICKNIHESENVELSDNEKQELHFQKVVSIKHSLSNSENVEENIWVNEAGRFIDFEMNRREFEELIDTDINNTLIKTVEIIERASQKGVKIDEIILTGGSSQIVAIERLLKSVFIEQGINVRTFRPEHAVVFGAARYAYNLEKKPLTQHAEYSYGIFIDETSRVKFLIDSEDVVPKVSRQLDISPLSCSTEIRVCRSKSTLCTADSLDYNDCNEVWRYRFDTASRQSHRFTLNLDDTHKVTVECEYPDGSKIVKNRLDD